MNFRRVNKNTLRVYHGTGDSAILAGDLIINKKNACFTSADGKISNYTLYKY